MIDLSTSYARFQILNGVAEQAQWQMESSWQPFPVPQCTCSRAARSPDRIIEESGVQGTRVANLLLFQVVTSVWSAVKELVENAIDAQATHIEVSVFHKMMWACDQKPRRTMYCTPYYWLLWRIFLQWVSLPGSWGSISRLLLAAILTKVNTWARTVALFLVGLLKCSTWFSGPPWRLRSGQSLRQRQWGRSCFLVGIIFSWPLWSGGGVVCSSICFRFPLWYNHIQQARSRRYDASHTFKSLLLMWNHVLSVFRSLQPLHLWLSRRGVGFSLCGVQVRKRFFFFYILSPFPGSLLWAREQKIRRQPRFLSQQMVKSLRRVPWLRRSPFNLKVCIKHPAHIISTLKADPAVYFC